MSTRDAPETGLGDRAGRLLDSARRTLLALALAGPDSAVRDHAARAATRLVWAGSWLDTPYAPASKRAAERPPDTKRAAGRLHEAADRFEELLEALEDDDPVVNANGVQTSCLAFAIVGATAAYLDRRVLEGTRHAAT